jgi:hypothetical protein
MSEDKKGYVVRDRRRFDADGAPRDGEDKDNGPAQAAPPRAAPEAPKAAPEAPKAPPRAAPSAPEERHRPLSREPVDFSSLVLSIATNAMVSLQGQSPDGRVPGRPNLPAAAQHIDILSMLEEKTRGNRSAEEEELLKNVLYDLRMNYVALANQLGVR